MRLLLYLTALCTAVHVEARTIAECKSHGLAVAEARLRCTRELDRQCREDYNLWDVADPDDDNVTCSDETFDDGTIWWTCVAECSGYCSPRPPSED